MPDRYTVVNGKKVERNLRGLALSLADLSPALENVGKDFRRQVEAQFALSGALPGVRSTWRKLSPFTRATKRGNRILIDRTELLQSYTDTRHKGNISDVVGNRARFGSRFKTRSNKGKLVPVVKFHQEGTQGAHPMHARPVVLGNPILDEEICDEVVDHLFRGWNR